VLVIGAILALLGMTGHPLLRGEQPSLPGHSSPTSYRAVRGCDLAGEICETATERAVMLDGSAQFLGSRVFAMHRQKWTSGPPRSSHVWRLK